MFITELNAIMMIIIRLNAITLTAIMLTVVAPFSWEGVSFPAK
jgi:hypothetical protein